MKARSHGDVEARSRHGHGGAIIARLFISINANVWTPEQDVGEARHALRFRNYFGGQMLKRVSGCPSGLPTSAVTALFVLPEYAVHHRNFVQGKETAPDNGGAGRMIMLSCEVAAKFGDPQDDLCK